jgi:hypothetical protein
LAASPLQLGRLVLAGVLLDRLLLWERISEVFVHLKDLLREDLNVVGRRMPCGTFCIVSGGQK